MNASIVLDVAAKVAKSLENNPFVPVNSRDVPIVEQIVEEKVGPVLAHLTNNEPWYQSRVTVGALITMGASVASAFGFALAPEDIDVLVGFVTTLGTLIGAGITLYGRWKARKPIGA